MQIVEVAYSGTIPVEPRTTSLAITVLDPEGARRPAEWWKSGRPNSPCLARAAALRVRLA
jgi:hypothetical protein